jgi:hypothetical protein
MAAQPSSDLGAGIAHNYFKALIPRVGLAWDSTGQGTWSIRTGYGVFYDPFSNGANIAATYPVSALPWVQFDQFTGKINFANPFIGHRLRCPTRLRRTHPGTYRSLLIDLSLFMVLAAVLMAIMPRYPGCR